jgi:hypothetical protein
MMRSLANDLDLHTIHRKVGVQMANNTFALKAAQKRDEELAQARLDAFVQANAAVAFQVKTALGVFVVQNQRREGAIGVCINCGESIFYTDEVAEVVGRFTHSHKTVHVECIRPTDTLA